MAEPHLKLERIRKVFGRHTALAGIDLDVEAGRYVVLLGPSGSGKTTLLSIIGGFIPPTAGIVRIGGKDLTIVPPVRRPTATVFQDYALFPHMSVGSNVGFGLTIRHVPKAERERRVERTLDLVGLSGFATRRVHELSGGQRQRVALARALLVEPEILLLDEPLGALDLHLRKQMQHELRRLQQSTGRMFVHVTHDQDEAMAIADFIVILNRGLIEDMGPPEKLYQRPASRFAATFMGESTLIDGRILRQEGASVLVETPLGSLPAFGTVPAGTEVTIAVRPENLTLGPVSGTGLKLATARVVETGFQGNHRRVRAVTETAKPVEFLIRIDPEASLSIGGAITVSARREHLVLLDR